MEIEETSEYKQLCECYGVKQNYTSNPDNWFEKKLPPFTAEKQLEIVKLIGLNRGFKIIRNMADDYMLSEDLYADEKLNKQGYGYGFDEALIGLLLNLQHYLDHAEVKRILEG